MSFNDDHMKAVAKRMAKRLRTGEKEHLLRRYLTHTCGWTDFEADQILKKARRAAQTQEED